jgi:hypothetical protein
VQAVLLTSLLEKVLQVATLYYVQRIPKTLGAFRWRIDAKDVTATPYEKLWQEVVGPFLQSRSLTSPLQSMEGADYSAFSRFSGEMPQAPEYLRAHVQKPQSRFSYLDLDAVLSDLRFCASHRTSGIQIVDMLAAGIRRACNGSLTATACKGLGRLMATPERGYDCVRFLALEDFNQPTLPYTRIVKEWNRESRRLVI